MAFLYLPLAVIVFYSFNAANSSAYFAGFSLRWYDKLIHNDQLLDALSNTLVLGITSSLLALVIGTLIGYGMYRHRARKLGWLIVLIYLPIVMPDIVFGISEMCVLHQHRSPVRHSRPQPADHDHRPRHLPDSVRGADRLLTLRRSRPTLFEAAKDLYASPFQRARFFLLRH
ncbi:ABC transporter permease [Salinicola tamaricis]|uniref:ABC transporter permease n=1 Tax=Salinicola tamaricis TaxID=1771309 RepID=UPI001F5CB6BE|nr:hypothetical protein [Salinicola tamaricis]